MDEQNQSFETLQDIRRIMERSSRFISLSGLSGIAAGVCALAGAFVAYYFLHNHYYERYNQRGYFSGAEFQELKLKLLVLAAGVLAAALVTAFYFTWRKAKNDKQPVWNKASQRLTVNMLIPLVAGGFFILTMLQYDEWRFIAPACLIFYGLALINASKYTLSEVRYLGLAEVVLGLVCAQKFFIGFGLYFWAVGFGLLHIVYGVIMWYRHERNEKGK